MQPDKLSPDRAARLKAVGEGMRTSKAMRWAIAIGATAMVAIGVVLIFLLTQATSNQALYERNYQRLFVLNIAVAAGLFLVIVWITWRLFSRLRRGKFGSRLLVKLAAVFALVGIAPGALIYVVSYQFVSRSIESWFDEKVEGALDAGLNLGRSTLDTLAADLSSKTRVAAVQLGEASNSAAGLALDRLREQLGAEDVILWGSNGQVIGSSGRSRFVLQPERPSAAQLRQVRNQRVVSQIDGLEDAVGAANVASPPAARVRVLAQVSAPNFGLNDEQRLLQVTQVLPASLVANAVAVQDAHREYQERSLARVGLRQMYIGTLTLSLFLAVFGAVLLAVLLGNQLVRPLFLLAEGVAQVAAGDLTPKAALQSKDELGGLTRDFALMTQQLLDARTDVQLGMAQVDSARAHLQTILDTLTAGVVVLDADQRIVSCNPSATRVLRTPIAAHLGHRLSQIPGLESFGAGVEQQFAATANDYAANDYEANDPDANQHTSHAVNGLGQWQQSFELHEHHTANTLQAANQQANTGNPFGSAHVINLIARGVHLTQTLGGNSEKNAYLLVFDDISEAVSAQRAQAWGEVARRLAHEIKNPLTPIQLSAERLELKLQGKLSEADDAILGKSVKTIVEQVDAMKRLVNEFRDYARLPEAKLAPLDLNELITQVLALYAIENAVVPISTELEADAPAIMGDAEQLRQVIHNLIQNAQDACMDRTDPLVVVSTRFNPENRRVRMTVRDNGAGFPEAILKRAFEPYITTKDRGTGLGLAVVKKIADDHGARIELSNRLSKENSKNSDVKTPQGAQVSLSFAVASSR